MPEIIILLVVVGIPVLGVVIVVRALRPSSRPPAIRGLAAPGWFVDPTGPHAHRYWDGGQWSAYVADAGVQAQDPL
jgi:hypothetical protein